MEVKAILAFGVVVISFFSLWVFSYFTLIDQPDKRKRHFASSVIAAVGAVLQAWVVSPSDGTAEISWVWLLLGILVALFLLAVACAAPGASRDVLASHASSRIDQDDKPERAKSSSKRAKTRAIQQGWSISIVAFTYEDAEGDISYRTVTVHSVSSTYLKGECHDKKAERTFRLDRIIGDVTDCETGEILSPKEWARRYN